jgi:hypothetical protein
MKGNFGDDITDLINTTFVLFGGTDTSTVSQTIPALPDKPMVIGYSFSQCYEKRSALSLLIQIEYALITKEALKLFSSFRKLH